MEAVAADRELLFGLLALQNGLINQAQLVAAFQAWTLERSKGLADHLVALGHLAPTRRPVVEAMAALHLEAHDGDVEKSLAAVPANLSTRASLAALGEPEIEATLARVARSPAGPATGADDDPDRTASLAVGAAAGDGQRFRLLRPHARGGLGAVFVALDTELHREVALKQILDQHADDPTSRARFLLEAEITGGLEHPGIVPIYGLGTYDGGRPYYAMRFIKGDSLKEAADRFHADEALKKDPGRRALELRQLLRRFVDVCDATGYAHSRGVLHRDIKPGNVIVGKYGETLVVDWGLAKATGRSDPGLDGGERTLVPSSASGSAETLPGSALGTPAYMSPEQAEGDIEHLGPRSDVYSLGATLYYILAGRPPQEGDIGEVLRAVQRGEFAPPRRHDPAIDPALEAVCLKAMAHRPGDRYASPKGLSEDLERWMADEPVSAWREPLSRRLRRWANRNRTAVTAATVALIAGLVGLTAVLAVQRRANDELRRLNGRLDRANGELRTAMDQKDAANAALAEANGRVQARFDLAREAIRSFKAGVEQEESLKEDRLRPLRDKLLGSARRFYDRLGELMQGQSDAASKGVLAESYAELGELIDRIGQRPEALEAYKKAVAIRRELAAAGAGSSARIELAKALNEQGGEAAQLGDHAGALAAHEEARSLAEPLATGPGATIEARRALGDALYRAGEALKSTGADGRALAAYRRARALQDPLARDAAAVPDDRLALADTMQGIGELQTRTGDLAGALVEQRGALEIRRALAAEHRAVAQYRSDLAVSHNSVGGLLEQTGDLAGALAEYREDQELFRALATEHPAVPNYRRELAVSHTSVGYVVEQTGDLAGALAEYRKGLELMRALAAEHPAVPQYRRHLGASHNRVGRLLEQTGDLAGALLEHRRSQELIRALAAEHPDIPDFRRDLAVSHNQVGLLLEQTGDLAGALAELRRYQELMRALAAEHPDIPDYRGKLAVSHNQVGRLLGRTGDTAGALVEQRKDQELMRSLAAEHPDVPQYRRHLAVSHYQGGLLLERTGDLAGALAELRKDQELMRALVVEHPDVPDYRRVLGGSHNGVGALLLKTGDLAGALVEQRRYQELMRALAVEHPAVTDYRRELAVSHTWVGNVLEQTGDLAGALVEQRSYQELMRALAADHPDVPDYRRDLAVSHDRVGGLLEQTGDLARALAEYRKGQEIVRALAAEHPAATVYRGNLAISHDRVGALLKKTGRPAEAEAEFREAVRLDGDHIGDAIGELGRLLAAGGRSGEAIGLLRPLLARLEERAAHEPVAIGVREDLGTGYDLLGQMLTADGKPSEALAAYRAGVAARQKLAAAHPEVPGYRRDVAVGLRRLAAFELDAGDNDAAVADARRAVDLLESLPPRDGGQWFSLGCARATLSAAVGRAGPGPSAAEATGLADRAMDALRRAAAMGWRNPAFNRRQPALGPLRDRDDFRELMLDLDFPAEPFAR